MGMKHLLGWGLIAWGALGVYNQFTVYQAAASGTPSVTSPFNAFDPANLLKIPAGAGLVSAPMLTDAAIAAVGAWLAFS